MCLECGSNNLLNLSCTVSYDAEEWLLCMGRIQVWSYLKCLAMMFTTMYMCQSVTCTILSHCQFFMVPHKPNTSKHILLVGLCVKMWPVSLKDCVSPLLSDSTSTVKTFKIILGNPSTIEQHLDLRTVYQYVPLELILGDSPYLLLCYREAKQIQGSSFLCS